MRAQELMKMTELPEGVELHSDVDEDATNHQINYKDRDDDVQVLQEFNILPRPA